MPIARRTLGVAAGLVALLPLLACGSSSPPSPAADGLTCTQNVGGPVTVAAGIRANSTRPVLPQAVEDLMQLAADHSAQIQLMRVDGAPSVAFSGIFRSAAGNDTARQHDRDAFINTAIAAFDTQLTARTPEVDDLLALNEAARLTPAGGTVVLLDSGLQTTGQIHFQDPGTLGADPTEMVTYLQKMGQLPDLSGRVVVLAGLGNTAAPQPEITNPDLRRQLENFWTLVAKQSHAACVQVLEIAQNRTTVASPYKVTLVPMPAPVSFQSCGTTVLHDDTVGFVADQATFRDPGAARSTLTNLANTVKQGHQLVTLVGTTSSAGTSEPDRVALSKQRAEAVKTVLVQLGVDAGAITTVGDGSHGPNQVNDRGPDGSLIPDKAALNRTVIVQLRCPTSG